MAHRDADAGGERSDRVTVRLVDVEPVAGLVAAAARFCAHLDRAAVEAMPQAAVEALSDVQSVLWRLEHAKPEG